MRSVLKWFTTPPAKQKVDEEEVLLHIKQNKATEGIEEVKHYYNLITKVLGYCTSNKVTELMKTKENITGSYSKLITEVYKCFDGMPETKPITEAKSSNRLLSSFEELKKDILQAVYARYIIEKQCGMLESWFRQGYLQVIEKNEDANLATKDLKLFLHSIDREPRDKFKSLIKGLSQKVQECNQAVPKVREEGGELSIPKFDPEPGFLEISLPKFEAKNAFEEQAASIAQQLFTTLLDDYTKAVNTLYVNMNREYKEGIQDRYEFPGGFEKAREEILKEYKPSISLEQLLDSAYQELAERKLSGGVGSEGENQEPILVSSVEHQEDDHHNEHSGVEILIPTAE
jgi:hypothetical protein